MRPGLVILVLATLVAGCGESPPAARLPDLVVTDIEGRSSAWRTDGSGFVLLNIWAPWCAPCVEEMPSLDRLDRGMPGLRVVGLAPGDDVLLADEFLRKHGIRFATFYDYQEQIETVLKISEYPSSLLLSPRGRILARVVGPREWDSDVQKQWLRERMAHNEQG